MEEEVAKFVKGERTKPVVAMIVGRAGTAGQPLGHAGAIIEGTKGAAQAKIDAFERCGSENRLHPSEIVEIIKGLKRW